MKNLRRVLIIFFIISITAAAAFAGPALQRDFTLTQPDGESFSAVKRGDEFMNWYETAEGYAVLKDGVRWYWVFALRAAAGLIAPSDVPYSAGAVAPEGAVKNFIPAKDTVERLRERYDGQAAANASSARSAAAKTWTSNPISGKREAVFIRINFQDAILESKLEDAKAEICGAEHSVRSYYLYQSHGKLNIVSADFGGQGKKDIIEITMTPDDYNEGKHPDRLLSDNAAGDYRISHKNEVAFVTSVLKRTGLDFSGFDKNGDGIVQADELVVYLLLAGYDESCSHKSPAVWMHACDSWKDNGSEHVVYISDDIILGYWSCGGELSEVFVESQDIPIPLVGGIVHELGHKICKLPDLYDTSYTNDGLGLFSVMADGTWGRRTGEILGTTPPNLDAWSRKYLGCDVHQTLTPGAKSVVLTCGTPRNGNYPVARINSPYVDSTYEYILAEVRNPNADDWDGGIGGGMDDVPASFKGGVLLQHIDERAGSGSFSAGNDFNVYTEEGHQGNMAIWADGDSREKYAGQGGYLSLWYAGNGTTPDTYFYGTRDSHTARRFSGIVFSGFSPSGEVVSSSVTRAKTGGSGCAAAVFPMFLLLGALPLVFRKRR
ncbi:MAG: hypothetical protein LUG14_08265 [Synergistaceae bacterium]|nr:hypothetical protein [Synergistaceae bacterium]